MSTVPHGAPAETAPVESLARELNVTIAALRASLECCRDEAPEPRSRTLEGALDQLGKLAERVHTLIDVARPARLSPLRCSTAELVHAARHQLDPELAERLQAGSVADARLRVDGPTVIRSLAYLMEGRRSRGPRPRRSRRPPA